MRLLYAIVGLALTGCSVSAQADEPTMKPMELSELPAVVSTTMPPTTTTEIVEVADPPVPTTTLPVPDPSLWNQYGSAEWGRCTQWEPLLAALTPAGGWNVDIMSKIMWRESRCDPTARSKTHDSGLLQINDMHLQSLTAMWGDIDIYDPTTNIRAAAVLCEESRRANRACTRPWGGTSK